MTSSKKLEVKTQKDGERWVLVVVGIKPGGKRFVKKDGTLTDNTHDKDLVTVCCDNPSVAIRRFKLENVCTRCYD